MKKILFFFSFFMLVGLSANAQCSKSTASGKKASCAKACAAKKTAQAESTTKVASAIAEAEVAAESDESIEKRVCEKSGSVSFYQKSVCEKSGKVSWNQVEYNSDSQSFTQVASASMEKDVETGEIKKGDKKSCSKSCAKKCTGEKKEGSK